MLGWCSRVWGDEVLRGGEWCSEDGMKREVVQGWVSWVQVLGGELRVLSWDRSPAMLVMVGVVSRECWLAVSVAADWVCDCGSWSRVERLNYVGVSRGWRDVV